MELMQMSAALRNAAVVVSIPFSATSISDIQSAWPFIPMKVRINAFIRYQIPAIYFIDIKFKLKEGEFISISIFFWATIF